MSLKPEVVRVRGVHSVTNPSQEGDIGFPQLQLEKLFEAATVRELLPGDQYNPKKKYAYLNPNWPADPNKYLSIENEAHFLCVRYGYQSLDGSVDHYYTKEGDGYKYNAVPPTGSWDAKLKFSNTIKDKELYSISREGERIYIDGQGYYKKENDDYKRQGDTVYETFKKSGEVDWSEGNKYKRESQYSTDANGQIVRDENGEPVITYIWQNGGNALADSGYYLSVHHIDSNTYTVKLLEMTFNDGVWEKTNQGVWDESANESSRLYKLGYDYSHKRIKNGANLSRLEFGKEIIFNYDPATTEDSSTYMANNNWSYPSTYHPDSFTVLLTDFDDNNWRDFDKADFPLFTPTSTEEIEKSKSDGHKVYEKLAVTVNYKYKDNNNLKFIFTDKSVDEVLDVCGLNNLNISKYVHLTNLEYSKNS